MRTLAVVTGASRAGPDPGRSPGRVAGFLGRLSELGAVDLLVVHDDAATLESRREWFAVTIGERGPARPGAVRTMEVAAPPLHAPGLSRELVVHRSDALERAAGSTAWFRLVDSWVAASPATHDLAWCGDMAALTRAGWIRRALPAVVDIDRFEDLGSARSRRTARRRACLAHLVTVDASDRRDLLAMPGSIVAEPDQDELPSRLLALADEAAAYRPARTS